MTDPETDEMSTEQDLNYAHLRLTRLPDMEVGFIRLVPAGTGSPSNTFTVDEAHLDVDVKGNIIGITWFRRR